jgi:hypothetical protein
MMVRNMSRMQQAAHLKTLISRVSRLRTMDAQGPAQAPQVSHQQIEVHGLSRPRQEELKLQEFLGDKLEGPEVLLRPYLGDRKVLQAGHTFHHSLHMHSSDL